jgi:formate hydrogenlyase subunit 3/multisubunit Na+/H+ antiporter MnhD subunit
MTKFKEYLHLILSIVSLLAAVRLFDLGRIAGSGPCTDIGFCNSNIVYSYDRWTLALSGLLFIFGLASLVISIRELSRRNTQK